MKKLIAAIAATVMLTPSAAFASQIPDHRGTSLDSFEIGTKKLVDRVTQYSDFFCQAGEQFGVDPNILAAICMQESGGVNYQYRSDGSEYPAWGIMQIEYTNEKNFAAFGLDQTGVEWTLDDRLDPQKSVLYAAYLLSETLYKYDCDYAKVLQAYNFGETVLNRIIALTEGDEWLDERKNAKDYVFSYWPYDTYGDAQYIEHVLRYYHNDIDYVGAKVRINDKLVKFNNQYPIIEDGSTLIPIRAVSEALGADVKWDGDDQCAIISKGNKTIKLYIGSNTAYINNKPYSIDAAAEMINNRTMVPLRFVAEALDAEIEWDGETRTVNIIY